MRSRLQGFEKHEGHGYPGEACELRNSHHRPRDLPPRSAYLLPQPFSDDPAAPAGETDGANPSRIRVFFEWFSINLLFYTRIFFLFEPLLLFFFRGVMDSFDFDFKWCWSRWWSLVTSSHLGNEAFPSKPSRIWYSFSVLGDLDAEISPENEASPITDLASFRAVGESIWNLTVSFFF